jgi:hypothetical protein
LGRYADNYTLATHVKRRIYHATGVVDNGLHREVITTLFDTGADGLYMDVRIARRLFDLRLVLATEKVNRQLIGTTGRSDIQLNVTVMLNFGFGLLPMIFEIRNTGGVVLVGSKALQR